MGIPLKSNIKGGKLIDNHNKCMLSIYIMAMKVVYLLHLVSLCLHLLPALALEVTESGEPGSAKLVCSASGARGSISWLKNNISIDFSDARISLVDGNLCISDIHVSDEALYKCCTGTDCSDNYPLYGELQA